MPSLKDVAQYVRSKAAGPFWVTIDIFCGDAATFERVRKAQSLSADAVAKLYGVSADSVRVFEVEPLNVLKISFPRLRPQGSPHDADSHAGQYFVPLLTAPVP
ncbi:DUF4387 domain-containing protein [Phenylobacterium sp.]|uniref:DUF4387 domain-containing protein n=1 Tax=Phenylobacterium sp. TaxID=1871053 RepID=UPI0035681989